MAILQANEKNVPSGNVSQHRRGNANNINKYFNSRNYNENNSHLLFKKIDRYVEKMCEMTLKSNEKTVAILHKLQEGFELED